MSTRQKIRIFIFTIFIIPSIVFSQGEYLEKNQGGVGISGKFSTNERGDAFGACLGYSFDGMFDIGFGYTVEVRGNGIINNILPSISMHVIKQNENLPVSVSVDVEYVKKMFSSDFSDGNKFEKSSSGLLVSGSLFKKMNVNQSFSIMPLFGVSLYVATFKYEYQNGNISEEKVANRNINLGLPIIFNMVNDNLLIISPEIYIAIDSEYNTYVIDLTYVLSN